MKMKVLEVGGVPVTIIAEKCGTPVYIYDEAKIEKQIQPSFLLPPQARVLLYKI